MRTLFRHLGGVSLLGKQVVLRATQGDWDWEEIVRALWSHGWREKCMSMVHLSGYAYRTMRVMLAQSTFCFIPHPRYPLRQA